jgi:hypothetical protein
VVVNFVTYRINIVIINFVTYKFCYVANLSTSNQPIFELTYFGTNLSEYLIIAYNCDFQSPFLEKKLIFSI